MGALRRRLGLAACVAAALACVACGGSRKAPASACVRVPAAFKGRNVLTTGDSILRVRRGETVFVALAEGEGMLEGGNPTGFPWFAPTSSAPAVLAAVPLCPQRRETSLPVAFSAFRARKPGHANLRAPVTPAWRAVRSPTVLPVTVVVHVSS